MPDTSIAQQFKSRIEQSKKFRRDLLDEWQNNVDYRRGKPFETDSDAHRIAVNKDWSMTKSKQAQLFSQVPEVRLTPKHQAFAQAVPIFATLLNDTLKREKVGAAMDEVLPDCINAAGIGGVLVSYEATTESVEVPAIDPATLAPEQQMALMSGQFKPPMVKVDRVVDQRFPIKALEPEDLLIDSEFVGSNFDDSSWIGHSGRMTWSEAKRAFNLKDSDKEKVLGDDRTSHELLNADQENYRLAEAKVASYDQIFYRSHLYHEDEKYYDAIHHLVFVKGLEEPVIDEPWKGQRFDENTGTYVGACKLPIRILTLTHVSGQAIPPSDTAIGRPQVNELIQIRSQMVQQREHSLPLRAVNTDVVDPTIVDQLMRGTWQGVVPIQGPNFANAIGELAKASFPQDDYRFDQIANRDLHEVWSLGPNQVGNFASGERSATEAGVIQQNFQTEIGYQRARVADFFVGIAEVLAGLLALYADFELAPPAMAGVGPDGIERLQSWDRTQINGEFVYDIRQDSTVRLDAQQRVQQLMSVLNLIGKAPGVNPRPIEEEIVALSGLDPAKIFFQPQPKGPDQPNISFRFSGEDLINPLVQSILIKAGYMAPQDVEAAKLAQQAAAQPPTGAQAVIPGAEPLQVPPMEDTQPEWVTPARIDKRRSDQ